ncbi:hypothetical protein DSECCO2_617370 [anaerobic digester metagenome]|jgi:hypothetical protein
MKNLKTISKSNYPITNLFKINPTELINHLKSYLNYLNVIFQIYKFVLKSCSFSRASNSSIFSSDNSITSSLKDSFASNINQASKVKKIIKPLEDEMNDF